MTDSRKLNRRVMIQAPERVDNGKGGSVKTWANLQEVWAEMIPLRGSEALDQVLKEQKQIWKVTIRHRDDVSPDHRLMFMAKPLNIITAEDPDGTRKWLVMTAESGVRT